MFDLITKTRLAKGLLLHSSPIYVQFYVTARCNLTCQQCNIIFANSDVRECTLVEIERIAENFAKIGVAIVLLTGGEPFVRKDLPEIVRAFVRNGIHVRMQTNGIASDEALARCVEYGGRDISISLDSLAPGLQDKINGGFDGSWGRAIETVSRLTRHLPRDDAFAAFGCVLMPGNIDDVEDVVEFGTRIGWYTSLVPIHITETSKPMNFRTYDKALAFKPEHYQRVDSLVEKLKETKRQGSLLYDSDEYLNDITRFVRNQPTQWRDKNHGLCDSPGLYFAVLPNGDFSVCCDYRLPGRGVSTYSSDFPKRYWDGEFRNAAVAVARGCSGCMFGSYPEITITARYWNATLERIRVFLAKPPIRNWPLTVKDIEDIASDILARRHLQVTRSSVGR